MNYLKTLFLKCALVSCFTQSLTLGADNTNHLIQKYEGGRIRVQTIIHYGSILDVIKKELERDPNQTFCLLTDVDCTTGAISNFDHKDFPRQGNIPQTISTVKGMNIPVIKITARWDHEWQANSLDGAIAYARSMEEKTGIITSDQDFARNLKLDLRKITSTKRGIFIEGTCFTGSSKGIVTSALIDQPAIPKATHYIFPEDDQDYVQKMIAAFKPRSERLTILHFPNEIEIEKHHHFLSINPLPIHHLPFLIRHKYSKDVKRILADNAAVTEITKHPTYPFLVDLVHSNSDGLMSHVTQIFRLKIEELAPDVFMEILWHAHHHKKTNSSKWLIQNASKDTLLKTTMEMIADGITSPMIKELFDAVPNSKYNSIVIDIFNWDGLMTIRNIQMPIDPFIKILDANIVWRSHLPALEAHVNQLNGENDHKIMVQTRLQEAQKQLAQ